MRLIVDGQAQAPQQVDPALLKAIARARCWFEEVASGRVRSLVEIDGRPPRATAGLERSAAASLRNLGPPIQTKHG
jgi:hypothetical protein